MANKIQFKRGLKASLPTLNVGEPGLCTDTKEVFVGNSAGNIGLVNKETFDAHLADYTQEVKTDSKQSVTLPHGLSILNAPRAAQLKPKFKGRQLCNLLGRDGNCEDVGKWGAYQVAANLDSANKVYGNNSIKLTLGLVTGTVGSIGMPAPASVSSGKYYLYAAELKNGNAQRMEICVSDAYQVASTDNIFRLVYRKFLGEHLVGKIPQIRLSGISGQYGYVDGIRLYEITQAEYNEIDTLTPAQIAERYPYVDSFQCVQNPAVRVEVENLIPPFSQWVLDSHYTMETPCSIKLTPTDIYQQGNSPPIPVLPGQIYTLVVPDFAGANFYWSIHKWSSNKADVGELNNTAINKIISFTVPNDIYYISVHTANQQTTGSFVFRNPMLILGNTIPTEFKPYNSSRLYLQTPLYEGETLEEIDGAWVRTKKWEKKVLDGSLPWVFDYNFTGYKSVKIAGINGSTSILSKYDGKILKSSGSTASYSDGYVPNLDYLYVMIPSSDSGWGENYTPTADENKAYFNGWKMYDSSKPFTTTPYNGSGNKAWAKIKFIDPVNGGVDVVNHSSNTCPTSSYPEYTPYQLHYQLATPTTEVVPHEGELALHEGANQVEVFEGVVVRDLANPNTASYPWNSELAYEINFAGRTSQLSYRTEKILNIYKNRLNDNTSWTFGRDQHCFGKERLWALASKVDPTAQYSVTYLALPEEFTAPLLSVAATYDSNIKSTVDTLVNELAKVTTDVTALEMALRNRGLLKKVPALFSKASVGQSVASSVSTILALGSTTINTGDFVLTTAGEVIIPEDGLYSIVGYTNIAPNATGNRVLKVAGNGTPFVGVSNQAVQGIDMPMVAATNYYLPKNTRVTLLATQNSGSSLTYSTSYLSITKLD